MANITLSNTRESTPCITEKSHTKFDNHCFSKTAVMVKIKCAVTHTLADESLHENPDQTD